MKKLLSPWFALVTLAVLLSVKVVDPSFIESVRMRYFDTLITSKPVTVSKQVHVVNIDDASLEKYGQFPFPRGQYANIINNLYDHGAGLVVFNVFLPDDDRFGQDNFTKPQIFTFKLVFSLVNKQTLPQKISRIVQNGPAFYGTQIFLK